MSPTSLVAIVAILAAIAVLHLALTFALIARVRLLQGKLAPAVDPALPRAGDPVGRFEVAAPEGGVLTDDLLRGAPTLVGFFSPHCKPCETLCAQLVASPPEIPLLAFVNGSAADDDSRALHATMARLGRAAYCLDGDAVTRAFRSAGFPTLVRVEAGAVVAAGHRLSDVQR